MPLDNELFDGMAGTPKGSPGVVGPYGLGVRVPLLVVSPWSTGGWVSSETFDHTSLIRFIEARFGVDEPNITPWRRAICGDLTSAFDFKSASDSVPTLPSVASYKPTGTAQRLLPSAPAGIGHGARPRSPGCGHPVDSATASTWPSTPEPTSLNLAVNNHGRLGVHLQARSLTVPGAPYSYTIGAGDDMASSSPTRASTTSASMARTASSATLPALR